MTSDSIDLFLARADDVLAGRLNQVDTAIELEAELDLAAAFRRGEPPNTDQDLVWYGGYVPPDDIEDALDWLIGPIFRRLGPERDRLTEWRRCQEEPWYSLANVLDGLTVKNEIDGEGAWPC